MNDLGNKLGSVFVDKIQKAISRMKFMEMGGNINITPEKPSNQDYSGKKEEFKRV